MLRGLPPDLCRAPVRHCVFKGVLLLLGNTASKIRTVKHMEDYPSSLQNMSVDALSRWPNFYPTFDVMRHDQGLKYLLAYIVRRPALGTCLQQKHVSYGKIFTSFGILLLAPAVDWQWILLLAPTVDWQWILLLAPAVDWQWILLLAPTVDWQWILLLAPTVDWQWILYKFCPRFGCTLQCVIWLYLQCVIWLYLQCVISYVAFIVTILVLGICKLCRWRGLFSSGYQTREVKLGRSFQCISLNILLVGKSLKLNL